MDPTRAVQMIRRKQANRVDFKYANDEWKVYKITDNKTRIDIIHDKLTEGGTDDGEKQEMEN